MKYLGGKQKLGKHIAKAMKELVPPSMVNGYLEPFCGALGVFIHMTDEYKCSASDIHPDLIQLWKDVQANVFTPPTSMTEQRYLEIKNSPGTSALKAFIGFGLAFGGRYYGSYAPNYTNGKKEDYLQAATNSIRKKQPLIESAKFFLKSYEKWKPQKKLIYCDPPYENSKFPIKYRTGTKEYDIFDNNAFWDVMRKWSKNNYVFISEVTAPDDFICIWEKRSHRSVAQSKLTSFKSKSDVHQTEKLFVHKSLEGKFHK